MTEAARTSVRAARPPLWRRLVRALPPYLYLLPGLACVGFWVYRPLVETVQLSFYNWNLLPSNPKTPVGLANYTQLIKSSQLGSSLWLTVLFILGMVPFTLLIPTVVGLLTRRASGRLAAVCISAISSGEAVSTVISQVPAVSCIHVPTLDTVDAIQRSRKSAICSGAKALELLRNGF